MTFVTSGEFSELGLLADVVVVVAVEIALIDVQLRHVHVGHEDRVQPAKQVFANFW